MVLGQEPEIVQNGVLVGPKTKYIQSRLKNASRAIKINHSGNGFGPGTRNGSKWRAGGSKN